nr:protein F15E11.10 [imported] - Caenorhabditis elegans [Caenorhabditis elegans]
MSQASLIIALVGLLSSLAACFINIFMLTKMERKKKDMILFYFRIFLDMVIGALVALFLLIGIINTSSPIQFSEMQSLMFYLGLASSNLVTVRSIIVLSVSTERAVATYMPMFFYKYHEQSPRISIILIAVSFGMFESLVLFVFCSFELNLSASCAAMGCATASQYMLLHLLVQSKAGFVLKLFETKSFGKIFEKEYKNLWDNLIFKINRLALIDVANVCLSDFFPFIVKQLSVLKIFELQVGYADLLKFNRWLILRILVPMEWQ